MRCQRCTGLVTHRYNVELGDWEGYCINCGAIPFEAKITTPHPHGLRRENRATMEDDPFLCECGNNKSEERKRCTSCNMKQAYAWRKNIKEERERARAELKKALAV